MWAAGFEQLPYLRNRSASDDRASYRVPLKLPELQFGPARVHSRRYSWGPHAFKGITRLVFTVNPKQIENNAAFPECSSTRRRVAATRDARD